MSNNDPHIIIAGGGIGGMAAALALINQGFRVDVYEQAQELREVGAGIQISPNGNRALDHLGVFKALEALSNNAEEKVVRLWNTGRTWKAFDLGPEAVDRYGYPYLTVYRPDLLQVLVDAVRAKSPNAVHLGKRASGFRQTADGVELHLETGETIHGDYLIGADGVHSKIRNALTGDQPAKFTGMLAWRGTIPMEGLPAHMHRSLATVWIGPTAHAVHYPLRGGKLMNFVATVERSDWQVESWSAEGTKDEFRNDFKGWHQDIQTLIDAAPSQFKWALMARPALETWANGRVALLGDACHPTLPLLAQGAVMAVEDAVVLGRALSLHREDIERGLKAYEKARSAVARRKVAGATDNLKRFHNKAFEQEDEAARFVELEWGREAIVDRYDWIFRDDVTQVAV